MAISKASVAAGLLGGGGGAIVVGGAIYMTSEEKSEAKVTEETLEKIREKITTWATSNGGCTINIKLESDKEPKTINQIEDKDALSSLFSFIEKEGNSDAKSKCKANKILEATKENNKDTPWTFKEVTPKEIDTEAEKLKTAKDKIDKWEKDNGGCKIKIKDGDTTKLVSEIEDKEKISDLEGLNSHLENASDKETIKTQCGEVGKTENKSLVATKGDSSSVWNITKEVTPTLQK